MGIALLALTTIGVTWVQLVNTIPPEGVFILLALGGVPAALSMLLAARWRSASEASY